MSSNRRGPNPPVPPLGVEVIALIMLVGSVVLEIIVIALAHTVRDGYVLFTNEITGHPYVASGWLSILVAVLINTAFCALGALAALYTLKGRMWGYWMLLAILMLNVVSRSLSALAGRSHLGIDFVGILMLIIYLSGFKRFREFARYQTHTRHPDRG